MPRANSSIQTPIIYREEDGRWRLDLEIVIPFIYQEREQICRQEQQRTALTLARNRLTAAQRGGQEVVIRNDPVVYTETSITPQQIESGRPSYISAILIAAAGQQVEVSQYDHIWSILTTE
jgi:hypothetical protein